jgi:hypothetical protein
MDVDNSEGDSSAPSTSMNDRGSNKISLSELPQEILQHTSTLREHVQYFVVHKGSSKGKVPESVQRLLDQVSGAEQLEEQIREEILQDDEARHASIIDLMPNRVIC